ncbi:hypothetical protein KIW84_020615 [Lathyrus oleraceus]|uniref:Uncharacterized protein n=1 Tax=Pisum sativum TaxID=3888 RepID=A0A9D5B4C1_PEA|nr:hypothetical protein KIW84_020615 [Pisum sativum]
MASSSLQQEKCNHGEDTRNIVLKKGTWSKEEDQLLREYVTKYGVGKWDSVRKKTKLVRDGKSCRIRWLNHLNSILKKCSFNEEERRKLIHLYNELGPKWSQMVSQFPGRTDNELKNFINSKKRSLKNSRKHLISENINHVDELNNNVGEISNQQNNASQEEEMEFDHQEDTLHGNYLLDQIYDDKNINNFQQFSTLADDLSTCFNNHAVPTLDDRFPTLPECSYFQDMEDIVPSFSSSNLFFDQEDTLHGNYLLDQIYDDKNINNFQQFSTLADDSSTCFNNHAVPTLDDRFSTLPECSYFQDMEDIVPSFSSSNMFFDQDLPPYNLDMDYQLPQEMFSDQYLQNPYLLSNMFFDQDLPPYNLDMDYQLPQEMFSDQYLQNPDLSSNMFFDQDLPPIPQYYPYNIDMDYQLPQEMHSDQYLQNPILSYEEPQYEILEPWLLSECVPLW